MIIERDNVSDIDRKSLLYQCTVRALSLYCQVFQTINKSRMENNQADGSLFGWLRKPKTPSGPTELNVVYTSGSESDCASDPSNDDKPTKTLTSAPTIDAEEYDMTHAKRGFAIVFCHDVFLSNNSPRNGAKIDKETIIKQFQALSFQVEVFENMKKSEVLSKLDKVANYDHSDSDCLVVVAMTHGDSNELCAFDTSYRTSKLWEAFTPDKSPSLAGKPKLFFIQACRGSRVDSGVRVSAIPRTQTDASPRATYTIPAMADILIANATFDGYFAWRNGVQGSWFIRELGKCLEKYSETKEICQILTAVNRQVAISYESYVPGNSSSHQKKQMPNFLSTLTRELYLKSKHK